MGNVWEGIMRVGLRGGLAALVLGLTLVSPGSAVGFTARSGSLKPARVHLIAAKANVLRALLRAENSVT